MDDQDHAGQGEGHAYRKRQRHRHDEGRGDRGPRHDRALGDQGVPPGPPGQGYQGQSRADRPVRRGLLFFLHGGRPDHGPFEEGRLEGPRGVKWESTGDGSFTVEEMEKKGKGTDVILHLREDEKQYLDEWEIRDVVHRYSDFIEHPIVMEVEKEQPSALDKSKTVKLREDETLNSRKALWLRDKSEITPEEYTQFYKHISHDVEEPLKVIHYKAEGTSEFTALLYIPSKLPFDIFYKDYKIGPMLYVKRVQIMEHCEELLPPYLRFVKGRGRFVRPAPQRIARDTAKQQAGGGHQEQHHQEGARDAGRAQEGRVREVPGSSTGSSALC